MPQVSDCFQASKRVVDQTAADGQLVDGAIGWCSLEIPEHVLNRLCVRDGSVLMKFEWESCE